MVVVGAEVGIGVVKALAPSKHGGDRLAVDRSLGLEASIGEAQHR